MNDESTEAANADDSTYTSSSRGTDNSLDMGDKSGTDRLRVAARYYAVLENGNMNGTEVGPSYISEGPNGRTLVVLKAPTARNGAAVDRGNLPTGNPAVSARATGTKGTV